MGTVIGPDGEQVQWGDFYLALGQAEAAAALPAHNHLSLPDDPYGHEDDPTTCDVLLDASMDPAEACWPEDFCPEPPHYECFDAYRVDWFPVCKKHAELIAKATGQQLV